MARRNLRQEFLRRKYHRKLVARSQHRPAEIKHAPAKRVYKGGK